MKKTIYILAVLLLMLLPLVLFTACEEKKCEHDYGEWKVVTEPTCGKAGKQTRICAKCEQSENKSISATGKHTFGDWTVETAPTCDIVNGEGERFHTCSVCDKTEYESIAPAGLHNYVNGVCTVCKEEAATVGLLYEAIDDMTCKVVGIGTATDTQIIIPLTNNGKRVVEIGDDAFEGCTAITKVTLTPSITKIGAGAFHGCTALTTVSMDFMARSALLTIGDAAFADCTKLAKVQIPSTLTAIGDWAFSGCTALTEVKMNNSAIQTIGVGAFRACTALVNFKIPASVTTLGARAFEACTSLEKVEVEAVKASGAATATSNLATIGTHAFYGCIKLDTVNLGANSKLQTIEKYAFEQCIALESITLPKSLQTIGIDVFKNCTALNAVTIEVEPAAKGQPANPCKWILTNAYDASEKPVTLTIESAADAAVYLKVTYPNYNWKRA